MKVTLSGIEINQTSETAGDPPVTYRSHVSIKLSRGRRLRNGKRLNKFQLFFDVCGGSPVGRWRDAGRSPAV